MLGVFAKKLFLTGDQLNNVPEGMNEVGANYAILIYKLIEY